MAIKFAPADPKPPETQPPKAKAADLPKPKRAPKGSFDRTAYQRELMRKRRAKEPQGGES